MSEFMHGIKLSSSEGTLGEREEASSLTNGVS